MPLTAFVNGWVRFIDDILQGRFVFDASRVLNFGHGVYFYIQGVYVLKEDT